LLSQNPNITMQNVLDNPEMPWNWYWLSKNPNITYKFIVEHINKIDFELLSENYLERDPVVRTRLRTARLRAIAKPLIYGLHVVLIPPLAEKVLDFLY